MYVGLTEPSGLNITNRGNDLVPLGTPAGINAGAAIAGYVGYGSLFGESSPDEEESDDELGSDDMYPGPPGEGINPPVGLGNPPVGLGNPPVGLGYPVGPGP